MRSAHPGTMYHHLLAFLLLKVLFIFDSSRFPLCLPSSLLHNTCSDGPRSPPRYLNALLLNRKISVFKHQLFTNVMTHDHDILQASARHPQPGRLFQYGTAGVSFVILGIHQQHR